MKHISIFGTYCIELPVFLAAILNKMQTETIIIDYSGELILAYAEPNEKGKYPEEIGSGLTKIYSASKAKSLKTKADFCIDYYGTTFCEIKNTDLLILCSDMYAFNIKKTRNVICNNENIETYLFINNYINSHKYGTKYIKTISNRPKAKILCKEYNSGDAMLIHNIGYEQLHLNKLSSNYKNVLLEIITSITGNYLKKKEVKNIFT